MVEVIQTNTCSQSAQSSKILFFFPTCGEFCTTLSGKTVLDNSRWYDKTVNVYNMYVSNIWKYLMGCLPQNWLQWKETKIINFAYINHQTDRTRLTKDFSSKGGCLKRIKDAWKFVTVGRDIGIWTGLQSNQIWHLQMLSYWHHNLHPRTGGPTSSPDTVKTLHPSGGLAVQDPHLGCTGVITWEAFSPQAD